MTNQKRGDRGARILDIMLQRYETQDREEALREFLRDLLHTGHFYPNELISQLNTAIHTEAEAPQIENRFAWYWRDEFDNLKLTVGSLDLQANSDGLLRASARYANEWTEFKRVPAIANEDDAEAALLEWADELAEKVA